MIASSRKSWRVPIEADDIFQLFRELAIIAQLEGLHPMRFETVRPPDAAHGGRTDGGHLRQRARPPAPPRAESGRPGRGRPRDHLDDLATAARIPHATPQYRWNAAIDQGDRRRSDIRSVTMPLAGSAIPAPSFADRDFAFRFSGAATGSGLSACGWAGSPRLWMHFQIRLMAVLRSLNFTTGVTPGSPFQVATSLAVGHWAATSAKFCSLAKASNGVVLAAAASAGLANTVMLLSLSIAKVFIIRFSFGPRSARSSHGSLGNRMKGKGILTKKRRW